MNRNAFTLTQRMIMLKEFSEINNLQHEDWWIELLARLQIEGFYTIFWKLPARDEIKSDIDIKYPTFALCTEFDFMTKGKFSDAGENLAAKKNAENFKKFIDNLKYLQENKVWNTVTYICFNPGNFGRYMFAPSYVWYSHKGMTQFTQNIRIAVKAANPHESFSHGFLESGVESLRALLGALQEQQGDTV